MIQQQQQPNLLRAFLRTRPSILQTVLPRVIQSSAEVAVNKQQIQQQQIQQQQKEQQKEEPQEDNNKQHVVVIASSSTFREALKQRGVELVPTSNRFRFLSDTVEEDPRKRQTLTENSVRNAAALIDRQVNLTKQAKDTSTNVLLRTKVNTRRRRRRRRVAEPTTKKEESDMKSLSSSKKSTTTTTSRNKTKSAKKNIQSQNDRSTTTTAAATTTKTNVVAAAAVAAASNTNSQQQNACVVASPSPSTAKMQKPTGMSDFEWKRQQRVLENQQKLNQMKLKLGVKL